MFARVHKFSGVLALVLVLGQAGLVAHMVKHEAASPGQCILCLNHITPLTGLAAAPPAALAVASVAQTVYIQSDRQPATRPVRRLQARAPPSLH